MQIPLSTIASMKELLPWKRQRVTHHEIELDRVWLLIFEAHHIESHA